MSLPPNASKQNRAVDKTLEHRVEELNKSDFNLLPQSCRAELLPHLAYMLSVDIVGLDEREQRVLIQNALEVRRHQGTPFAIKKMFESLNMQAEVSEWFSYGGEPYHFSLDLILENKEITQKRVRSIHKQLAFAKNARSVLDELMLSYTVKNSVFVYSGGVGEVCINSEMLEGYSETLKGFQRVHIGAVGEVSYTAHQI